MAKQTDKTTQSVINEDQVAGLRRHSENVNKIVVESLKEALLQLIGKKNFESITITELCQKAGVSRMAFYGNFESKDDIFTKIVADMQSEMLARIGSPFRQELTLSWYIQMFEFVREKSNLLKPIFGAGFQDKYLAILNDIVLTYKDPHSNEPYLKLLWNGGIVNAVVYWLNNGLVETPDEMAQYCYKCFGNLNC